MPSLPTAPFGDRLEELARLFFTPGVAGFEGPTPHVAMMEEEVVRKRKWLTPQAFLDLVGATDLNPSLNSTEMTMHLGSARVGWPGLFVAGASFIIPAAGLALVLAWLYMRSTQIPNATPSLAGVAVAALVIVMDALTCPGFPGRPVRGYAARRRLCCA